MAWPALFVAVAAGVPLSISFAVAVRMSRFGVAGAELGILESAGGVVVAAVVEEVDFDSRSPSLAMTKTQPAYPLSI